ncbi:MarR family winged helix-turn-helix transcriptional regulator [Phormidesmis sp. 146-35]
MRQQSCCHHSPDADLWVSMMSEGSDRMSLEEVCSTHIKSAFPGLHRSLLDIVGAMNRPELDQAMLEMAGLSLETALFTPLVLIAKLGPIGVVNLAGRVGRDYTTLSRQVARLEELGLVSRQINSADRRIREAVITQKGKIATDAIDEARERIALTLFQGWSRDDFDQLVRLLRMLADGFNETPGGNV